MGIWAWKPFFFGQTYWYYVTLYLHLTHEMVGLITFVVKPTPHFRMIKSSNFNWDVWIIIIILNPSFNPLCFLINWAQWFLLVFSQRPTGTRWKIHHRAARSETEATPSGEMPQEAVTFCSLEGLASAGPLGLGFQPWMPWAWGPWRHFRGRIFAKTRMKTRRLIMCQYFRNLGTFPKLGLTKWAKNGIYWNRMGKLPQIVVGRGFPAHGWQ